MTREQRLLDAMAEKDAALIAVVNRLETIRVADAYAPSVQDLILRCDAAIREDGAARFKLEVVAPPDDMEPKLRAAFEASVRQRAESEEAELNLCLINHGVSPEAVRAAIEMFMARKASRQRGLKPGPITPNAVV